MKVKLKIAIGVLLLAILISYSYNNFFSHSTIVGKYVNRNYQNNIIAEVPNTADTLVLFNNNRFESKFFGKGNYKISYSFEGTHIILKYKDEFGKAGFETSISRINWGRPKIILDSD